jgi:hypothetical protein
MMHSSPISWSVLSVTGTKIMKTNDEKTYLNLNPNIEHKIEIKLQEAKDKNMKFVIESANKSLL